jgi:hypothetical protein
MKKLVTTLALGSLLFAGTANAHGNGGRDALVGAIVGGVIGGIIVDGIRRPAPPVYVTPPPVYSQPPMVCQWVPGYDAFNRPVMVQYCYPAY